MKTIDNKPRLKCECGADFYKPHKCPRCGRVVGGEVVDYSIADCFMGIFGYKRIKSQNK